MKRRMWITAAVASAAILLAAALWAANKIEASRTEAPTLMPDGALLFLQSTDFGGLLKSWNESAEKRAWLQGDNYQAFSRSRLFERLSQAGDEYSAAAGIATGESLLSSIAGRQSGLALYDIGTLEFVYVTRMDQSAAESTPLWRVRDKFESRKEGEADFYVHQDAQSGRTAAFAIRNGWLVLGTRADLVAGVLDRLQGVAAHSLPDEAWYADAVQRSARPADDLRMVLNLEKIVPSPYFRSYWVQRNITEMKQYRSALSDLHRTEEVYREDRILLRKTATAATTSDVQALARLAPEQAAFYAAQTAPSADEVLAGLRENLLDLKPAQEQHPWTAPAAAPVDNAGNAAMLEQRIDQAPVIHSQADPYRELHDLLDQTQPSSMLEVYATSDAPDATFAGIDRAVAIEAAQDWRQDAVQSSLVAALRPGLTASELGLEWVPQSGSGSAGKSEYFALSGELKMYLAVHGKVILMSSSEKLLQQMLARGTQPGTGKAASQFSGVTYAASFRHTPQERANFLTIATHLDRLGQAKSEVSDAGETGNTPEERQPPFFSGNIASLSRMFAGVREETVVEKDQGAQVTQTVSYQWQRK
jgi:hypothetical protein